jgi:hypothetical protein
MVDVSSLAVSLLFIPIASTRHLSTFTPALSLSLKDIEGHLHG